MFELNILIWDYRVDYKNRPSNAISFIPTVASSFGLLHCELLRILFLQAHRETDRFFAASGVQLPQSNQCHSRRVVFCSQLKSNAGNILTKTVVLRYYCVVNSIELTRSLFPWLRFCLVREYPEVSNVLEIILGGKNRIIE